MASKEDIQRHYDVNNDFYKLFLDTNYRAYSCGVWDGATTLEEAQAKKLSRLASYAHIKQGGSILDIGCGWGGMMSYALDECRASSAYGITLSQHQYDYMSAFNNNKATVDLMNWCDLDTEKKFDAVVSIGAFEHFASLSDKFKKNHVEVYRSFFKKCWDITVDGSYLGLQTIVTVRMPESRRELKDVKMLLRDVFPGSSLPTISDIQASAAGLYEINKLELIGKDYKKTLDCWLDRLKENKENIIQSYGSGVYHSYFEYFVAAGSCFESGLIDLLQISLKRVAQAPWYIK